MTYPLSSSTPHIDIYLQLIDRKGNKRDDERAALQQLLHSNRIKGLPPKVEIIHRGDGAPHFPSEIDLGISISHSDHVLAVAIYPRDLRVGIDIEERYDKAAMLISRVANPTELGLLSLHQLPPVVLWGAKEAVFKAYSDQISTMSEQVTLTSCLVDDHALSLRIKPETNTHPQDTIVYYRFSSDLGEQPSHQILSYPFVLSIATNDPTADFSVRY